MKKTSSWFRQDTKTNASGRIEDRRPEERGKEKYRELPIPKEVEDEAR